jgi:hypothetical protein
MITIAIFVIIVLFSIIVAMNKSAGDGWATFFLLLITWFVGFIIYDTKFDAEAIAARQAEEAAKAARRRAEETPHVVREADGCKVYAFLSGDRYHYFTRCPDSKTTTEASWDECHTEMVGKVSTKKCVTKSESIEVTK